MKIDIEQALAERIDEIMEGAAELVAETATEYFKETFRRKAFDQNPWAPPRRPKQSGSLLVQSGALLNSIRPVLVSPRRIVIAAGNEKVTYAQVHNEGFSGQAVVPAHVRRTRRGEQQVRQHTRNMRIPQRQFLGDARELEEQLHAELEAYAESMLNK